MLKMGRAKKNRNREKADIGEEQWTKTSRNKERKGQKRTKTLTKQTHLCLFTAKMLGLACHSFV